MPNIDPFEYIVILPIMILLTLFMKKGTELMVVYTRWTPSAPRSLANALQTSLSDSDT